VKHDNNFDLLRLLAALQVVAVHAYDFLHVPFPAAISLFPGVPVFFVISGFLITGSYIDRGRNVWVYARSRFLRIYPALWVNLAAIAALCLYTGNMGLSSANWWRFLSYFGIVAATASTYLAEQIVITQSFAGYGPPLLLAFPGGVLWTVAVELSFYVLTPILFRRHWRWWQLAVAFCISLATALSLRKIDSLALLVSVVPYLWIFLIGAACRLAWTRVRFLFDNTFPLWLALHFALGNSPDFNINPTPQSMLGVVTLAGCTMSFAYTLPGLARFLNKQDISYGIYLYHAPVILTLEMLGYRQHASMWIVVLGITTFLATLSWLFVERPCLNLKRTNRLHLGVGKKPNASPAANETVIPAKNGSEGIKNLTIGG
jgi:peptidoglycan/LPS O-acetylase OafA/YrhL